MSQEELDSLMRVYKSPLIWHQVLYPTVNGSENTLRNLLKEAIDNFEALKFSSITSEQKLELMRDAVQVVRQHFGHWARVCLS
jgi:hypothetical protein